MDTRTLTFTVAALALLTVSCTRCTTDRSGAKSHVPSDGTPAKASCVVEVAGSGDAICVLSKSGRTTCFGREGKFGHVPVTGKRVAGPAMKHISAKDEFVGIDRNGKVWGWGFGAYQAIAVPELGDKNVEAQMVGSKYFVVRENGDVERFQPGDYGKPESTGVLLSGVKHVGKGCASTGEEVLCWGYDYEGLYHPPQPKAFSDPYPPETRFRGAIKTFGETAGADCALTRAGEVWCWGMNSNGTMGIGSFVFCPDDSGFSKCEANKHPEPGRVTLPEAMVDLATTAYAVCALGKSGRVWCWGNNSTANVRYPPVETHRTAGSRGSRGVAYYIEPSPVLNEDLDNDNGRLFGGGSNMCAEKSDGSLWCWGDNYYSQVSTKPHEGEHRRRVPPMRMSFECP